MIPMQSTLKSKTVFEPDSSPKLIARSFYKTKTSARQQLEITYEWFLMNVKVSLHL